MQIYVLNNEEMKTIMNILIIIISDTSKDSFICCKFSFYWSNALQAPLVDTLPLVHVGFFLFFFSFANEQNFAVFIKTRYFWRTEPLDLIN